MRIIFIILTLCFFSFESYSQSIIEESKTNILGTGPYYYNFNNQHIFGYTERSLNSDFKNTVYIICLNENQKFNWKFQYPKNILTSIWDMFFINNQIVVLTSSLNRTLDTAYQELLFIDLQGKLLKTLRFEANIQDLVTVSNLDIYIIGTYSKYAKLNGPLYLNSFYSIINVDSSFNIKWSKNYNKCPVFANGYSSINYTKNKKYLYSITSEFLPEEYEANLPFYFQIPYYKKFSLYDFQGNILKEIKLTNKKQEIEAYVYNENYINYISYYIESDSLRVYNFNNFDVKKNKTTTTKLNTINQNIFCGKYTKYNDNFYLIDYIWHSDFVEISQFDLNGKLIKKKKCQVLFAKNMEFPYFDIISDNSMIIYGMYDSDENSKKTMYQIFDF